MQTAWWVFWFVVASASSSVSPEAKIESIGPRIISNQTSYPLSIRGQGLKTGMQLELGGVKASLTAIDAQHAYVRIPPGVSIPKKEMEALIEVKLQGKETGQRIRVLNDTAFPMLTSLALNQTKAFVASTSEDVVYVLNSTDDSVVKVPVGDGPTALAPWRDGVVVCHRFSKEVGVLSSDGKVKMLPAVANVEAMIVIKDVAYLAEHAGDSIAAIDLKSGKQLWRTPVAPNPGSMVATAKGLAVGSHQTGEIELLDFASGKWLGSVEPAPKTAIVGPKTIGGNGPEMSDFVMNGSMQRALAFSAKASRLFSANIGPNIGPNPKKMEVAMNGGISVVDVSSRSASYLRHVGFGGGVTQALALDDAKGVLYAADLGLGIVRIIDARKLGGARAKDAEAAVVQEVKIEPPKDFPWVRPAQDFGVKGRATTAVHSGPAALALSNDGRKLYVLNRFSGTLAVVDVQNAEKKAAKVVKQVSLTQMLDQASRRKGEVLYFTDVGHTAVTCDSCHPAGHTGGVMFAKTSPLRVYRAGTVRGALETAPYFTPASTFSIGQTVKYVMERNRYGNPSPTPEELEDLARFASAIPTLPNPWADENGAPPEELTLPDGSLSHPRVGMKLFEGKAECASCHPGPHFTTDQDLPTRGKYLDVGTPHLTPIREDLQDPLFRGFGVPALVGIWDVFPMLTTGMAGLKVEGNRLKVGTRFPLRRAVADFAPKHGRADVLSKEELNDLLGYVQSL